MRRGQDGPRAPAVRQHPAPVSALALRRATGMRPARAHPRPVTHLVLRPVPVITVAQGPHPAQDPRPALVTPLARVMLPVPVMPPVTVARQAPRLDLDSRLRHPPVSRTCHGSTPAATRGRGQDTACRPATTCRAVSPCLPGRVLAGLPRRASTPTPTRPARAPAAVRGGMRPAARRLATVPPGMPLLDTRRQAPVRPATPRLVPAGQAPRGRPRIRRRSTAGTRP
jgi:hypothetical protein